MEAARRHTKREKLLLVLALAVIALGTISIGAVTWSRPDLPFANEQFAGLWTRTDAPRVRAHRPLYWGETPWFTGAEFYRQGANGLRTVQYFDKGRMDLAGGAGPDGQPGVVSGSLVKELVSGRIQLGDSPGDVDLRQPATIPVAGDLTDNPLVPPYAAFAAITTIDNDYRDVKRIGQLVDATLDVSGQVGNRPELATAATTIVEYDELTGHNLPSVFWEFIQRRGIVQTGAQVSTGLMVDWLVTLGHPISDPYWVRAVVGGVERDLLVQLFERRVLTYAPGSPAGYEVEMGNVGQHYVAWRYPHLGQPWVERTPTPMIVYAASDENATDEWTLQQWTLQGGATALADAPAGMRPFSIRRSWTGDTLWLAGDSTGDNGLYRQVYAIDMVSSAETVRLTYSDGTRAQDVPYPGALPRGAANEYQPAVSPDGTKIAFVSDRTGKPELFLMPWGGGNPVQLTASDCLTETPAWSPDGRTLVWANNCDGDYELYSGALAYREDSSAGLAAMLTDIRKLTDNTSDDRFPSVAPDGSRIAFTSTRDGQSQLYMSGIDGSGQHRLLASDADDETPVWSPDGNALAFGSNRLGRYQLFTLNLQTGGVIQLTQGAGESRWPVWVS